MGGIFSKHLDELVKAGFVKRDFTWDLKSRKEKKLSRYRLSDHVNGVEERVVDERYFDKIVDFGKLLRG